MWFQKKKLPELTEEQTIIIDALNLALCGNAWVGRCPFHDERTPSFNFYPSTGRYYCFGCGDSGTIEGLMEDLVHTKMGFAWSKILEGGMIG